MWGGSRKSKPIPTPLCNARLKFRPILTPPPLRGEENLRRAKLTSLLEGQNGHLSLLLKLSSKMYLFWNVLAKCLYFETRFLENRVSMKSSIWWKSSNMRNFTWNSSSIFFFLVWFHITRFSKNRVFHWNLIYRDILLDSFKIWAFCWKVLAKVTNAHFDPIGDSGFDKVDVSVVGRVKFIYTRQY